MCMSIRCAHNHTKRNMIVQTAQCSSLLSLRGFRHGASRFWPSANHRLVQSNSISKSAMSKIILWRQKPLLEKAGHYLRIIRLPIVAYGIYTIGYRQAIIDSHQQPLKFQQELLDGIIKATIDTSQDDDEKDLEVTTISEMDLNDKKNAGNIDSEYQVARVAKRLIRQAHKHVDEELHKAKEAVKRRFNEGTMLNAEELQHEYDKDKNVKFWTEAKTRIAGDDLDTEPWRFVFIGNTLSVNAFVTEACPKRIFITRSLYSFAQNIDEIAFILGHELAHLILGHSSQSNKTELSLRTTEIVLLSLDPTAGIVTFAVVALLDLVGQAVEMAFSRDCEREADELGLRLVAFSDGNYDLEAGAKFMYRLHTLETKSAVTLLDTHPPSLERARAIYHAGKDLAEEVEKLKAATPVVPWTTKILTLFRSVGE